MSLTGTDDTTAFTWTNQLNEIVIWTSVGPAIGAVLGALVVLAFALVLSVNPETRTALHRQSFIMLLSSLLVSLIYSASYIVECLITGPTTWCNVSMIFGIFSTLFMQFLVMLIAVNLQLVFVHGLSTRGWVKWYILGSFVCALAITLPGAIKGVWGWDLNTNFCWTAITDPHQRFIWHMASLYFWTLFSTFVTTVSTFLVLGTLLFYSFQRRRVLSITQRTHNTIFNDTARAVAWRISVYPSIMIVTNCISAASDFSIDESQGITSWWSYVLWCTYGAFFGALPLCYAIVAIFFDPSFSSAVSSIIRSAASSGRRSIPVHLHCRSRSSSATAQDSHPMQDVASHPTIPRPDIESSSSPCPRDIPPSQSGKDMLSGGGSVDPRQPFTSAIYCSRQDDALDEM
ncbi:hypothetical protein JAAARDRAFT_207617 [Jaapia argillacea MUCL 33604]|uniref:G-protein coupled receptors family 2 profile 2 domain-containing protein n=1 Tax=Jaapia argillacea MUCL 33604 TaxID=933084 RepID=A0A067PU20_9AGAM|nr:hypothetical protein JAAARDRAFT_207617 [Jaapia argillacea MUCL 33604]